MGYCTDCGSKAYRGLCTNCHEENFIETQYEDLGIATPTSIYKKARKNEFDVYLLPIQDNIRNVPNSKPE